MADDYTKRTVRLRYIGRRAFLYIGSDGVKGIPVRSIESVEYRKLSYSSWVNIKTRDGKEHYYDSNNHANEIIEWLTAQENPTFPTGE